MNRKGFTLVELLATIIVLAVVVGITIPVSLSVINNSREKSLEMFIKNIETASLNLATECNSSSNIELCSKVDNSSGITLRELAVYGFLSHQNNNNSTEIQVFNPKTKEDVSSCMIKVNSDGSYNNLTCSFLGSTNNNSGKINNGKITD